MDRLLCGKQGSGYLPVCRLLCLTFPVGNHCFQTGFTAQRQVCQTSLSHAQYGESFAKAMRNVEQSENNGCRPEKLGKAICDGTDIYDSSVSCFAHERQHHRTHTDGTREIRIHLVLYLLLGSEFDSSADAHPGIVDKYID